MVRSSEGVSRRRFLQTLTLGATGLAGCSLFEDSKTPTRSRPTSSVGRTPARGRELRTVPEALERAYDTVHNIVQLGADHTGRRSVTDVLASALDDGTALYLPRGEYRMETPLAIESFSDLALVGDRALVRPPQGFAAALFEFGADGDATDLRFDGIDFDLTARRTGARPIHAAVRDGLLVRDVTVHGRQDVNQDSMRFDVTTDSGSGRIESLRLPDGGISRYPITGIYVGEATTGQLSFVDCLVAGFPDNGLYASPARGRITVRGGVYANNGIASVRVSGPSRVRNVRVICNEARQGLENMRGIRLREGEDILVDNCDIQLRQVTSSDGAITMAEWLDAARIRNTRVQVDADGVIGIRAKAPTPGRSARSGIELADVRVVGQAATETAIAVSNRDACRFDRVCIRQPGADRDGITLRNSANSTLAKTVIDVTGDPLVLDNARPRRQQVHTDGFGRRCF